jgi:hypothetical protein
VVLGGENVVGELAGDVGKLSAAAIGVRRAREGCSAARLNGGGWNSPATMLRWKLGCGY